MKEFIPKKCAYAFGCIFSVKGGAFGFCPRHYSAYRNKVKRGRADWDEIKKRTQSFFELTDLGKQYLICSEYKHHKYSEKKYDIFIG